MSTSAQKRKAGDRGRVPYRFTAKQVMKMIATGIIADGEDVELWDGILYKMTKGELHNQIVMLTADAIRTVTPREKYHVREEKSNSDGPHSLPEPDVTVVRGKMGVLTPRPPDLERVALVVEVDHHTAYADGTVKYSRYAERRIPVYWLIEAKQQIVLVFDTPQGAGAEAHYARTQRYSGDDRDPDRPRRPGGRPRRGVAVVPGAGSRPDTLSRISAGNHFTGRPQPSALPVRSARWLRRAGPRGRRRRRSDRRGLGTFPPRSGHKPSGRAA